MSLPINKKYFTISTILFFCSGFTSLIYQIIWIRQLSLSVGSTSASMSIVLSLFFSGLALGSYGISQVHTRIQNPMRMYGFLEGLIGLFSFFLVYIFFNFQTMLAYIYPNGALSVFSQFLKFFIVFLLLIIPTCAMGATLPLLIKYSEKNGINKTESVGLLYGMNTLGAVVGSFLCGFFLTPKIGIEWSNHLAVLINLTLCLVAILISKKQQSPYTALVQRSLPLPISNRTVSKTESMVYLAIALACGFSTISAEVVWNKYLGIFMGTNIFGLSLLLGIILLGIGIGSLSLPKIKIRFNSIRSKNLLLILGILLLTSIFMSTHLLGKLPSFTTLLNFYIGKHLSLLQIKFVTTFFLILPSTFFSGMILPLLIEILSEESRDLPKATGSIYAVNTTGSIIASGLTGLFLIPTFGSTLTMKLALIALAFTLLALAAIQFSQHKNRIYIVVSFFFGLTFIVTQTKLEFSNIIRSAYHQNFDSFGSASELLKALTNDHETFIKIIEGQTAIISLSHDKADGENYQQYYRLKTNGLNESIYDSRNKDALPKYEALLGLLPYTLTENPKSAFLVGYGGGFSTHFLGSTNLKRVQVAELEKGIIEAANYVWKNNNPILKHPNVELQIEDARFLLAVGNGAPYDIIASQPSHSWLSGVANLFTLEFFELVKSRLTNKGTFSQWLNLYNINENVLKSILKTFYTVFPHGAVFTNPSDDELILIGSLSPLAFDLNKADEFIESPKIKPLLKLSTIKNGYDLLAHLTLTRDQAITLSKDAPLNTDRNAFAEVAQSKLFYSPTEKKVQTFLDQNFNPEYETILASDRNPSNFDWNKLLIALNESSNFNKYNTVLDSHKIDHLNWVDRLNAYYQMERYQAAFNIAEQNLDQIKTSEQLNLVLQLQLTREDYSSMTKLFEQHKSKLTSYSLCLLLEAQIQQNDLTPASATAHLLETNYAKSYRGCGDSLMFYLGHYYLKVGHFKKAVSYLDSFYQSNPLHLKGVHFLIGSLIGANLPDSSSAFMKVYLDLKREEALRIQTLAEYFQSINATKDAQLLRKKLEIL